MQSTGITLCRTLIGLAPRHSISSRCLRFASSTPQYKTTCLYEFHKRHQARMEAFAGYQMPIVYKNQTIRSEHLQTRTKASAFDVSHMLQTVIHGDDRHKFIESFTVADIQGMAVNRGTLSMFLNENGGIIDDCIINKLEDCLYVVSNAGNADIIWSWLTKKLADSDFRVELECLDRNGLIALQGPEAARVLQERVKLNLSELEFMSTARAEIEGLVEPCQITRCGYTGEDGFEISVQAKEADDLMELLCSHSLVQAAGLGARDTLRLEAGLCLHGHDISDKTTPVEASLNWTIHKRRRSEGGFLGSHVVLNQLKEGVSVKRCGLIATGEGPPAREGALVFDADQEIGKVTSGTHAPILSRNIAMAYLPTAMSTQYDKIVQCRIRGKSYDYKICKMPFVKSNYYINKRKA